MKINQIKEVGERGRSGFLWLLLGTMGQNVLQLLSILVLARVLRAEDFGVVGVGASIIAFLRIFSEVGVGPALVQKEHLESGDVKTAVTLSVMLGSILAVLLYLTSGTIALFFDAGGLDGVLKSLAFMLPLVGYSVVGQSLLQRNFEFKKLSVITFVSYFFAYGVVSIVMALNGYGVWSLVGAYWVQAVLFTCLILGVCRESHKIGFDKARALAMMDYGVGYSIARLCNYAAGQGDNLVIGKILGVGAVGLYGRAYQIMSMPAILFGSVIDKVFFPMMANMRGDTERLTRFYLSSIYFSLLIFVFFSGYIYSFSREIVFILFGSGWDEVVTLIQIMATGLYFRIGYKFSDCLTMAIGKVYSRAGVQLVYAAAVVGFVSVGSFWGLPGAAIGVVVAVLLNYIMMTLLVWRILRFGLMGLLMRHVKIGVFFMISFEAFSLLNRQLVLSNAALEFVVSSALYVAVPLILMAACYKLFVDELSIARFVIFRRIESKEKKQKSGVE